VRIRYDEACPPGQAFRIDPTAYTLEHEGVEWQPFEGDEPFIVMHPADRHRERYVLTQLARPKEDPSG
jgi:hypothetical protein